MNDSHYREKVKILSIDWLIIQYSTHTLVKVRKISFSCLWLFTVIKKA